jgi:hypothetical protein
MDTPLENLLATMAHAARRDNLSNRDWAQKANVRPETLSRLKLRGDCDLTTLAALANAVDLRVALVPKSKTSLPRQFSREDEEKLLVLCASRTLDLAKWRAGGSAFFMAGVAMMVAGARGADRPALLALAEALYPGMSSVDTFRAWLAKSPLRPSRFLPMLQQRMHR